MEKVDYYNIYNVVGILKDKFLYDDALSLLDIISDKSHERKYCHLKAQCIYQNHTIPLPLHVRFDQALKVLGKFQDNETKRLKGAVYKRKYQQTQNIRDLYHAIKYYQDASNDFEEDCGYGAGNVIYLYFELLDDFGDSLHSDTKTEYLSRAKELAEKSLDILEKKENEGQLEEWNYASMAGLYLSLGKFEKYQKALKEYKNLTDSSYNDKIHQEIVKSVEAIAPKIAKKIKNHEGLLNRKRFVTIEQLIKLYDVLPDEVKVKIHIEEFEESLSIFGNYEAMIDSVRAGKVGLALSGGGFRASLFHIGVFMRLAELDILRRVQVISSVSGGSIIAMHYYLKLKVLLESKEDKDIGKQDYIDLVDELKTEFVKGVQTNIRMQAFKGDSCVPLTKRIGELYQKEFYSKIEGNDITMMKELLVVPHGYSDFSPHFNNFEIANKVPMLIINATLLNNGHNWQFTAKGMGENSYMYDMTVDKKPIYKYAEYEEFLAGDSGSDISIGDAIAASSAVPMLFDPLRLEKLYKEESLELSDGGLYDNLGLASLVNEDCTRIVVSDGSKQLEEEKNPSTLRLKVLFRLQSILMEKSRDGEYRMAKELNRTGFIDSLAILHLKDGFTNDTYTPKSFNDAKDSLALEKELQNKLASVRTDLDAFHDVESNALIYGGYKISSYWFEKHGQENGWENKWKSFDLGGKQGVNFSTFEEKYAADKEGVLSILGTSSIVLLKVFKFKGLKYILALLPVFLLLLSFLWFFPKTFLSFLIVAGMVYILGESKLKYLISGIFTLGMKPISWYYMWFLNKMYLDEGKL